MRVDVITLFPEMFSALNYGITGRAQQRNLLELHYCNPRKFSPNGRIDDRCYGGGAGMIMQVLPLRRAIRAVRAQQNASVIYLSPQGQRLDQAALQHLSQRQGLILLAGRYEGIDQRLIDRDIDEQWSIGDYVLSGGELAAMVMIDAITRLLPHALGHSESAQEDSFTQGLLEYPQYTRPAVIGDQIVPKILQSGDHAAIKTWRKRQALYQTWLKRPDLLQKRQLTLEEQQWLQDFITL